MTEGNLMDSGVMDVATVPDTWVMYPEQLKLTFDRVDPGTVIVYAVGDLGYARQTERGNKRRDINEAADCALGLWERGVAELTQKRLAPHKSEYRVTKL